MTCILRSLWMLFLIVIAAGALADDDGLERMVKWVPELQRRVDQALSLKLEPGCQMPSIPSVRPVLVRDRDYAEGSFVLHQTLKLGADPQLELKLSAEGMSPDFRRLVEDPKGQVILVPIESSVIAEKTTADRVEKTKMWKVVALGTGLAVPAIMFNTVVHEGAHALVLSLEGYDIVAFKPYPHFQEEGGKRRFYFGGVEYQEPVREDWWVQRAEPRRPVWVADIAPQIVDVSVLATYYTLLETDRLSQDRLGKMALLMMPIAGFIDMANQATQGVLFSNPYSDFSKFKKDIGANRGIARFAADTTELAFVAAGAYVVSRGFLDLRSDRGPSKQAKRSGVSVTLNGKGIGIVGTF